MDSCYTTTEIAAWWGAFIATGVLFWDVYKWKHSGARISITISPNMILVGGGYKKSENYLISVAVVNTGTLPTKLNSLTLQSYKNRLALLLNKFDSTKGAINPRYLREQLPCLLPPGEEWRGELPHFDALNFLEGNSSPYLRICIDHGVTKSVLGRSLHVGNLRRSKQSQSSAQQPIGNGIESEEGV